MSNLALQSYRNDPNVAGRAKKVQSQGGVAGAMTMGVYDAYGPSHAALESWKRYFHAGRVQRGAAPIATATTMMVASERAGVADDSD